MVPSKGTKQEHGAGIDKQGGRAADGCDPPTSTSIGPIPVPRLGYSLATHQFLLPHLHSNGSHSRSPTSMRDAECLMEVQM